jgi:antitoxin VapB
MLKHMPVKRMPGRPVKLFKNGRNQALRIPREFELPGDSAIIRKEGDRLIIEPAPRKSLLAVLDTLAPLEEELAPTHSHVVLTTAQGRSMSLPRPCHGRYSGPAGLAPRKYISRE